MVKLRLRRAVAFFLCLTLATPAALAQQRPGEPSSGAQPTKQESEEAQRRYKHGIELFNEGAYDAALIEFRRANELAPSYKILYNIGQVSRQLNDYARAVDAFERYLREGGSSIPASRVAEVQRELERLHPRVARVEVSSNLTGAEISVDDLAIGRTPLSQPLSVNAGRRKVTAALEGRAPLTRVIDVAGGESTKVSFDFVDASTEALRGTEPSRAGDSTKTSGASAAPGLTAIPSGPTAIDLSVAHSSRRRDTPWLLWGGAAALGVGAAVTGVLALGASNDVENFRKTAVPQDRSSAYDDARSRMLRFSVATDVLAGLAVLTGVVALYVTLKPARGSVGLAGTSVAASVTPGGVLVHGRF